MPRAVVLGSLRVQLREGHLVVEPGEGPPRTGATVVDRPGWRLLRDRGRRRPVVVIGGGPGWGRTSLAAGYAADHDGAWLRIGPEHADPHRLAADLVAALGVTADPAVPPTDGTAADQVPAPTDGVADDPTTTVLEACARARTDALVLDDAHRATGDGARVLREVIAARPPAVQLIVTTREPDRAVAVRDLASGDVLRLDASHLALDAAAITTLLAAELGTPDEMLAARIVERTGGWPVAVRLVVDALADVPREGRLERLDAVTGPAGPVSAYLRDAVLPTLPAAATDAATQLALLGPRDAAAFGAATGTSEHTAQERLDDLVARGLARRRGSRGGAGRVAVLPIVARTLVERELPDQPTGDALVADLVATLRANGDTATAVDVLGRCGRPAAVAQVLEEEGWALLRSGALRTLREATSELPLAETPELALLRAHACAYLGDWDGAGSALAVLPSATPPPPEVALATGIVCHLRGDLAGALAAYARSQPVEGAVAVELDGWSSTAHWLRGEVSHAREEAEAAHRGATERGDDRLLALAHTALALVAASDGDRAANQRHYDLALAAARRSGDALQEARILTNRGSLHLEEGRFDAARVETEAAIDLAEAQGSVQIGAIARCNRAEILLRTGSLDEAIADAQLARDRFASIGSRHESYAHHILGDARREQGELVLARRAYERSLQLSEPTGDRQGNVPALLGLARTSITSDLDAAEAAAARALELDDGLLRASVLLVHGWIALARGDVAHAAAHVRDAEEEAIRRGDRIALAEATTLGALLTDDPRPGLRDAASQWRELDSRISATRVELGLARRSSRATDRARAGELERQLRSWGCAVEHTAFAHAAVLGGHDGPRTTVRVLGEFAVERDGHPVPPSAWGSRKARDLLKVLATRGARGATREELADLLWPDEAYDVVANRLSVALSVLRNVLSPEDAPKSAPSPVSTDGPMVRLDAARVELDLGRFERLAEAGLDAARGHDRTAAIDALDAAERAYGGDLLEHDGDVAGVVERREHLRSTYVTVTRALARLLIDRDPDRSVRLLLRVLDRDPHDEPAHLAVCAALVRAGRHGEARRRHELYVARMAELDLPAVPLVDVTPPAGDLREEPA